ncbi:hypothetical protein HK097_010383, partial [Rhizophlyctis rosea]
MKKLLQLTQAAIALNNHSYVFSHPAVTHNPIYPTSVTFQDLCEKYYPFISDSNNGCVFAKLLIAFVDFRRARYPKTAPPCISSPMFYEGGAFQAERTLERLHSKSGVAEYTLFEGLSKGPKCRG